MLSTPNYHLRWMPLALFLLILVWGCSPSPKQVSESDLALDTKLWHIFTGLHEIRQDVETNFKGKKLTPEEAKKCFERNRETLASLGRELTSLKESTPQEYAQQLEDLSKAMDIALNLAEKTYNEKHIYNLKEAKKVVDTLKRLSQEIPIQRARYLLNSGCDTEQIYEIMRRDGLKDRDIQNFILQAKKNLQDK